MTINLEIVAANLTIGVDLAQISSLGGFPFGLSFDNRVSESGEDVEKITNSTFLFPGRLGRFQVRESSVRVIECDRAERHTAGGNLHWLRWADRSRNTATAAVTSNFKDDAYTKEV